MALLIVGRLNRSLQAEHAPERFEAERQLVGFGMFWLR
jgi:hypothetical protein